MKIGLVQEICIPRTVIVTDIVRNAARTLELKHHFEKSSTSNLYDTISVSLLFIENVLSLLHSRNPSNTYSRSNFTSKVGLKSGR